MIINANTILVFPSTAQKISEYRQLSVRSFFLSNAQATAVAESIRTILKTESLVVDENLNMLIMRDSPDAIRLAERLVRLHDSSSPEVVLEVEILEVNRTTLREIGVNLSKEVGFSINETQQSSEWQTIDQLRGLNSGSIYASVPNASVRLSENTSNASILANPRIRVQNRETARVLIGDRVPVITSTSTSTGFVSETVNYVDVGLKLEVQPSIYASNEVAIKVNLEVSRLVREIQTQSGTLSYQIGTRNAETTLRLRDGETQILAGLINQEDRRTGAGWPWMTRFPVLNRLFGTRRTDLQDTEIVLSITPRLIRGVAPADLSEMLFESGTAMRLGATPMLASASMGAADEEQANGVATSGQSPAPAVTPVVSPVVTPLADAGAARAQPLPAPAQTMLGWSAPSEVRVGEQFTAVLNISAMQAIEQVPLMLGFSPQVLQVVSVEEGPFMTQGGGQSSLSQQVNLSEGKISATVTRQGSAVSGQGALLNVTFRALAPSPGTELTILSAQTQPEAGAVRTVSTSLTVK
nr:secretin N-terminal domain-containing protein [Luteimonas sp. BDR2-5]